MAMIRRLVRMSLPQGLQTGKTLASGARRGQAGAAENFSPPAQDSQKPAV
jgi:hypothetical protein